MRFLRLTVVEMQRALHRRLVRWMILISAVLCALAGVSVFLTSRDAVRFAQDEGHPARMVNWWAGGGGGDFLSTGALFLVVGAAICGASVAGAEWRAGTMTTMLTWVPSRVRLHGARTCSAGFLSFVISFLIQVLYLAAAIPAVVTHGSTAGTDASWWAALLLAMMRISLVTSLVAVLAVSLASLGRNTSAALVVLATWALVIERLVAGLWPRHLRDETGPLGCPVCHPARFDDRVGNSGRRRRSVLGGVPPPPGIVSRDDCRARCDRQQHH